MRKSVVTLSVASPLSLTSVAPVFAGGWGGRYYGRGCGFNPLWPITAALAIPAAVIGTVVNLAATVPATYGYAAPQGRETYYAPGAYYAPRAYGAPTGYYARRGYYPVSGYRASRSG